MGQLREAMCGRLHLASVKATSLAGVEKKGLSHPVGIMERSKDGEATACHLD